MEKNAGQVSIEQVSRSNRLYSHLHVASGSKVLSASKMKSLTSSNIVIFVTVLSSLSSAVELITVSDKADFLSLTPSCNVDFHKSAVSKQCVTNSCARRVTDGLFEESDMKMLHTIVEKGMSLRPALGGPTILDINTGSDYL